MLYPCNDLLPVKKENETTLHSTVIRMISWMCAVKLLHKLSCATETKAGNVG